LHPLCRRQHGFLLQERRLSSGIRLCGIYSICLQELPLQLGRHSGGCAHGVGACSRVQHQCIMLTLGASPRMLSAPAELQCAAGGRHRRHDPQLWQHRQGHHALPPADAQ
jgi:hypothetical protein